tara:strand:- start:1643 stop:2059 length:417 start_codon:yes stop_codon:yes gene_type:complete
VVACLFGKDPNNPFKTPAESLTIDCNVLTRQDWRALAWLTQQLIGPFGCVEAVPVGGQEFAKALKPYIQSRSDVVLIAKDILITGESIEKQRNGRVAKGVVVFARSVPPSWVLPLFTITQPTVLPIREKQELAEVPCG